MKREPYDVLDLKALRCFYAMTKHGSITQAGNELGISDAAVSQRLKALESYLGIKLYESRGGHVTLTAAGDRTFSLASSIFDVIETFEDAIGQGDVAGDVSIVTNDAIARYLLPDKIDALYRVHPLAHVKLVIRPVEESIRLVRMNECDLGIIAKRKLPRELEFNLIQQYPSCLITPKGHPLAKRARQDFNSILSREVLMQYPLIVMDRTQEGKRLDEALVQLNLSLTPTLELGSSDTLKHYVIRGLGVGLISSLSIVPDDEAHLDIIPVPSELNSEVSFGVIMRHDKFVSPLLASFREMLLNGDCSPPCQARLPTS
ncbi:LysR family transcriptional regulator [Marinobacterium rhizophilum]|uniref:LysR family transcriptional regulator n=1 Tax=Marinobacterium rhizophilum TaxID=420402 RepID=A0ABY5HK79_9GAMM|nr:LysR family transcriptional regulator [Marinobacterium rhizophilum]UTW12698.1 LysR family transcriptional regulator [Marinobacterium rhizophilum]